MMTPEWTILVATIGRRAESFKRLMTNLLQQVEPYNGKATVTALWNNGERPLADVRQALVESATSRYVSFVDDDDEIPPYHVNEVMHAIVHNDVDYVGWRMQCYVDGVALKPTFHSLRYSGWSDDRKGYYRDTSHLNPVRTMLAKRCDFRKTAPPEDVAWARQLRPLVVSEVFIERIMYIYHSSTSDSTWHPGSVKRENHTRVEISDPHFTYHPWSYDFDGMVVQ